MIPAFAAAVALAGCAGRDEDFLARAPDALVRAARSPGREALNERIAHHAKLNGLPESLVHAVVRRESKYDPTLRHGPYWGLMQIRHDTARSMGYAGPASGLLDAETNLTFAVAYLANAYRVARGDEKRAIRLYQRGFYLEAKRRGRLGELRPAPASPPAAPSEAPAAPQAPAAAEEAAASPQAPAAEAPASPQAPEMGETAAR